MKRSHHLVKTLMKKLLKKVSRVVVRLNLYIYLVNISYSLSFFTFIICLFMIHLIFFTPISFYSFILLITLCKIVLNKYFYQIFLIKHCFLRTHNPHLMFKVTCLTIIWWHLVSHYTLWVFFSSTKIDCNYFQQ